MGTTSAANKKANPSGVCRTTTASGRVASVTWEAGASKEGSSALEKVTHSLVRRIHAKGKAVVVEERGFHVKEGSWRMGTRVVAPRQAPARRHCSTTGEPLEPLRRHTPTGEGAPCTLPGAVITNHKQGDEPYGAQLHHYHRAVGIVGSAVLY
jgi:hypothetical protein